jgi:hypothetical protein
MRITTMTVNDLVKGRTYEVIREFRDYFGGVFEAGQRLVFTERHFLPYHGGHTIVFGPVSLLLQEEVNADILDHLEQYLREC